MRKGGWTGEFYLLGDQGGQRLRRKDKKEGGSDSDLFHFYGTKGGFRSTEDGKLGGFGLAKRGRISGKDFH